MAWTSSLKTNLFCISSISSGKYPGTPWDSNFLDSCLRRNDRYLPHLVIPAQAGIYKQLPLFIELLPYFLVPKLQLGNEKKSSLPKLVEILRFKGDRFLATEP